MGFFGEAQAATVSPGIAAADTITGNGPLPPSPPPPLPPPPPMGTKTAGAGTIVSTPSMDQAVAFDTKFKGTPLEGKWDVVRSSAERNNISPSLAAAVMAHETGNGSNVKGNNPGGIMDPATNWQRKKSFDSIDTGIDATVKTIARNYERAGGSIEGLANIYAPQGAKNDRAGLNKDWLPGVRKQISFFDGN